MTEASDDYMYKMGGAIWAAIIETGKVGDGKTTVLMSGEIVKALLMTAAYMAASSEAASTPQKRRELCEAASKKMRNYLNEAREIFERGEMNMIVRPSVFN